VKPEGAGWKWSVVEEVATEPAPNVGGGFRAFDVLHGSGLAAPFLHRLPQLLHPRIAGNGDSVAVRVEEPKVTAKRGVRLTLPTVIVSGVASMVRLRSG
jgi:hypothetical protein